MAWSILLLILIYSSFLGGIKSINKNYNVYDSELSLLSIGISQLSLDSFRNPQVNTKQEIAASYVRSLEGTLKVYQPFAFQNLRNELKLSDAIYLSNLLPKNLICINSDSKSGGRFWVSNDGYLVIKTLKHYELKTLKAVLSQYFQHCFSNRHSMIASILGIYRIKRKGQLFSKYYLVTRNVFPFVGAKDSFICKKYDLKGSKFGRVASPKSSVEKDINLIQSGQGF
jgi:hypothetical protein